MNVKPMDSLSNYNSNETSFDIANPSVSSYRIGCLCHVSPTGHSMFAPNTASVCQAKGPINIPGTH